MKEISFCRIVFFAEFCPLYLWVSSGQQSTVVMNIVYLLLGGNQGPVAETFREAIGLINQKLGEVVQQSSLYESEPWGFESDSLFLNQVIKLHTAVDAFDLMDRILEIEKQLGRQRLSGEMASRMIDIDILFFNDRVIDHSRLQVPHPRLHLRRFTLLPMKELAPWLVHPLLQQTISQLLENCPDQSQVKRLDEMPPNIE